MSLVLTKSVVRSPQKSHVLTRSRDSSLRVSYTRRSALQVNNKLMNGLSPTFFEKVNGRLAMNGFVIGTVVQQVTGSSYSEQLVHEAPLVVAMSALITYASYKTDAIDVWPSQKPFMPAIELLNGRIAMLGMLAGFLSSKV